MTRKLSRSITNFYNCTEAIAKLLEQYTEGDRIEDMTEINKFVEAFRDEWGPNAHKRPGSMEHSSIHRKN